MTDTHAAASAERAERIVEVLRHRDPADADLQAGAMVMAGLTVLRETRGTPEVLDTLSRLGAALVRGEPAAPEPSEAASAATRDTYAEELYAIVLARPPAIGRAQADAMMSAGVGFLIARAGADAAIAALGQLAERVRAAVARQEQAPAEPAPVQPADLVGAALDHLHAMRPEDAKAQARAAVAAGSAFLAEVGEAPAPAGAADAVPPPSLAEMTSDQIALGVLDGLRTMAPDLAHEHARTLIAGSAAHLVEARGPVYAAAVMDGLLTSATRHIEVWGASPRPDGVALH